MPAEWTINENETLSIPGSTMLVFHDFYPEGHQGGIELILHGERVITNGDLRLADTPGQWDLIPELISRSVFADTQQLQVILEFPGSGIRYMILIWGEGESLRIDVDLVNDLPEGNLGSPGFNLELFPELFFGRSYQIGNQFGIFPRQANGPLGTDKVVTPLGSGSKLVTAMETDRFHMEIERLDGDLILLDGRNTAENGWFVVRAPVIKDVAGKVVSLKITPHRIAGWSRQPVMLFSQAGYHPCGEKKLLVELDPQHPFLGPVTLELLDPERGIIPVCVGVLTGWGKFLCYDYAFFDFSQIEQHGLYQLRMGNQVTPPFPISSDVYQRNVWQPTLETHLPVQMCHMKVVDNMRIWHGTCHLDDALQAPLDQVHFDSYRQSDQTETPYQPLEHVPLLNQGGWHDAGDFDLAAGSQAETTYILALAAEEFELESDQTTVRWDERLVILHQPDGIPDIIEQVAHGALSLLTSYRVFRMHGWEGHSFIGIIEDSLERYALLGDTASMSDNRIYDSELDRIAVEGDRSGSEDDRWVFTNRNTSLEYKVIRALLAAGRVLRGWFDELSEECLQTAVTAWEEEQRRPVADNSNCYVPGHPEIQEILAAIELLVTTGDESSRQMIGSTDDKYRQLILSKWDVIEPNLLWVASSLSRVIDRLDNPSFKEKYEHSLEKMAQDLAKELGANPFGVPFRPHVWGVGWSIQSFAVYGYFLVKKYPLLFGHELLQRALNYILGCHPASNTSLVSGVGANSLLVAYGQNRAEWSYIPGGVASGPNLIRPEYPELKEPFPYIWQQSEYVIGGAASHIFLTLAVERLLGEG